MHSGISVVDVCDNLVGLGGNDRAGVKFLAVGRCPGVKQADEGIGFSVPHGNSHRLFPPVHLLPLVGRRQGSCIVYVQTVDEKLVSPAAFRRGR
jgi:hypothetical protein